MRGTCRKLLTYACAFFKNIDVNTGKKRSLEKVYSHRIFSYVKMLTEKTAPMPPYTYPQNPAPHGKYYFTRLLFTPQVFHYNFGRIIMTIYREFVSNCIILRTDFGGYVYALMS